MRRLVALAVACAIAGAASLEARSVTLEPMARLRPLDDISERALADGFERSPTFRRLVARLQRSDVIVYIRARHDMPPWLGGGLRFVTSSASDRFVIVTLNPRNSRSMLVALLGHELQHAVEVADAPDVASSDTLSALYRRIGVHVSADAWDSRAAQQTGQVVRTEYLESPGETRLARHLSTREDALLQGASIGAAVNAER